VDLAGPHRFRRRLRSKKSDEINATLVMLNCDRVVVKEPDRVTGVMAELGITESKGHDGNEGD
jgi:hypothetical protein